MKILTFFVRYGDLHYKHAFKNLLKLYEKIKLYDVEIIFIDNALPAEFSANLGNRITMIGGDNTRHEFSGWQKALEKYNKKILQFDLLHFVTSAFENEYNGFYDRINLALIDKFFTKKTAILGHIDAFDAKVWALGREFSSWMCSKFFFAPPSLLEDITTFISPIQKDIFFTSFDKGIFNKKAPLSSNYQEYLIKWICGEGFNYGKWHSTFELTAFTFEKFKAKAFAIIDEHLLTQRMLESGYDLIDFTWLSTKKNITTIPEITKQVKERNIYLYNTPLLKHHFEVIEKKFAPLTNQLNTIYNLDELFEIKCIHWLIWRGHHVINRKFDLTTIHGRAKLYFWLEQNYPNVNLLSTLNTQEKKWLNEPVHFIEGDPKEIITNGLRVFCNAIDYLDYFFPLNNQHSINNFIAWYSFTYLQIILDQLVINSSNIIFAKTSTAIKNALTIFINDKNLKKIFTKEEKIKNTLLRYIKKAVLIQKSFEFDLPNKPELNILFGKLLYVLHSDIHQIVFSTTYANKLFPIPFLFLIIWQANPYLQKHFDLDQTKHRAAFYFYLFQEESKLQNLINFTQAEQEWLIKPDAEILQDTILPITQGIHALWFARDDLKKYKLTKKEDRNSFICWYFHQGLSLCSWPLLSSDQFMKVDHTLSQKDEIITCGMHLLWLVREDLLNLYDLTLLQDRIKYIEWFDWQQKYALHPVTFTEYKYFTKEKNLIKNLLLLFKPKEVCSEIQNRGKCKSKGANIIGYATGELGIGEDVRMAAEALAVMQFPFCVFDAPLSISSSINDYSASAYSTKQLQYNINLIFMPFYETLRLKLATNDMIFKNRYNIGCWQWELSNWPTYATLALELIHEFWSSSNFTKNAIEKITDKKVFLLPMAVELPPLIKTYLREDFALPKKAFIFLTIFDGFSSIHRKNPLATIYAFQKAFPNRKKQGVHLVIKTMHLGDVHAKEWQLFNKACLHDPNITLISEIFPREKVIGLQSVCDCFISLHRAEGFGRNIAEAMLLKKPVIVSNYSGNTDFTLPQTAFLVDGHLIPLEKEQYFFWENQVWFEPHIDQASMLMQQCVEDTATRNRLANAGFQFLKRNYNSNIIGKHYKERIDLISEHENVVV